MGVEVPAQHPDLHRSLQLEYKGRNGQVWYAQYESIRTHLALSGQICCLEIAISTEEGSRWGKRV
jgi:hypothetical protein